MNTIHITGMSLLTPEGLHSVGRSPQHEAVFDRSLHKGSSLPSGLIRVSSRKGFNRFSDFGKLCCMAVEEALGTRAESIGSAKSAGSPGYDSDPDGSLRTALVIGNGVSSLHAVAALQDDAVKYGEGNVNPRIFPDTVMNSIGGYVSIYFSIRGTNVTVSNGGTTAPKAFLYASALLDQGEHDRVIVCVANLFPPERFRDRLGIPDPGCEWISAFVLEPPNGGGVPLARLQIRTESGREQGSGGSADVPANEFDLELIARTQSLAGGTWVTVLGAEGVLHACVHLPGKEEAVS
ncbi:beta-ketoacyl synthase N-terminal-like domain-containing protein [Paenibacillus chitinolyticus]|uniref:beta-ketoacyl synthase N-terminal-like domain-containing protein n=1 Tax=Paenibacillus chitinolyticus TaxID=79263 RepID=UPI002DB8A6A1|nr:beta-ketoacyl synthase N-terminal-like domain-containing protein [Paenibacillus chitinolyticus]MEC0248488.1 beta-ketoacyl synthase N-terminal-like domain-containing protein [Paenibacillus chitinolyticus]